MLISEFARAAGLSTDTVRFYVKRGLLTPATSGKGGSHPYQIFTPAHLQSARIIRLAQSLGFSLKEIALLNAEYQASTMTVERRADILRQQLGRLEEKAAQLMSMTAYIKAKLSWLEDGSIGAEPDFGTFARGAVAQSGNERRMALASESIKGPALGQAK